MPGVATQVIVLTSAACVDDPGDTAGVIAQLETGSGRIGTVLNVTRGIVEQTRADGA